ncbi:MAG: aspartate/glutamate racemase family protein, partial [Roseibacillus sp.]
CTMADFLDTNYLDMLKDEDLPALEHQIVLRGSADQENAQSWNDFLERSEDVSEAAAHERAAQVSPEDLSDLLSIIERMEAEEKCDAVVLGCTELPLILNDEVSPLPTLDSTRLLARAAIREATASAIKLPPHTAPPRC